MLSSSPTKRPLAASGRGDTARWVVVGVLVFTGLFAMLATGWVLRPLDGLLTKQACAQYGDVVGREVMSYERSNRVALVGRRSGSCTYAAPATDPAAGELTVAIPDTDPSRLYGAVKVMLFVVELGAASTAVRILADPLLDRFVRNRPE